MQVDFLKRVSLCVVAPGGGARGGHGVVRLQVEGWGGVATQRPPHSSGPEACPSRQVVAPVACLLAEGQQLEDVYTT